MAQKKRKKGTGRVRVRKPKSLPEVWDSLERGARRRLLRELDATRGSVLAVHRRRWSALPRWARLGLKRLSLAGGGGR